MNNRNYPEKTWSDPRLEKRDSPIHGTGVFATAPIKAGEHIATPGGIVFTSAEWAAINQQLEPGRAYNEDRLDDDLFMVMPIDEDMCYFFNHSCDPNFWGGTTRRDIAAGEEITFDLALEDMDEDYLLEPCRCGSSLCRGRVTGEDWRLPDLQQRYAGRFRPRIERKIAALREIG